MDENLSSTRGCRSSIPGLAKKYLPKLPSLPKHAGGESLPQRCGANDSYVQHCCWIATILRRINRHTQAAQSVALPDSARHPDTKLADFLAQRIAVKTKKIRRTHLIAVCRGERRRHQRPLKFDEQSIIKADRR